MILLLVLSSITIIVSAEKASYSLREGPKHFEDFVNEHNKAYSSEEEKAMRYKIFLSNLEKINLLNAKYNYTEFGVTSFSDLTEDEFLAKHTCYKSPPDSDYVGMCKLVTEQMTKRNINLGIPTQFDWRDKHVVTRVKNQGNCGSCWAFSTIGNVESMNAIKTGKLLELSEQQVVDCDHNFPDSGCDGGFPAIAFHYLMDNGAMSSTSYPYAGAQAKCRYDSGQVAVRVKDCILFNGTEDFIAQQLFKNGPLSIGLDATPLFHYTGGILHGDHCRSQDVNHAVLLVGYGVENNMPYWLVKNSWGADKEEHGYFRMQRGVNCLNFMSSQPPLSAVV